MEASELKLLCRICFTEKTEMQQIRDESFFYTQISECFNVQVSKCEAWPDKICQNCEKDFENALKFRANVEAAEQILKNFTNCTEEDGVDQTQKYDEIEALEEATETGESQFSSIIIPKLTKDEKPPIIKGIIKQENPDGTFRTLIRLVRNPGKTSTETQASTVAKDCFQCESCGAIFNRKSALRAHTRRHTAEKNQTCEVCQKSFAMPVELRRHMRSHSGDKPYSCRHCPKSFSDFGTRVKHERIHTGERPFKCTYCPKSFTYSHVLKFHIMAHTGEKNYACTECNKRFIKSHQLKSHLATHGLATSPRKRKTETTKDLKEMPSEKVQFTDVLTQSPTTIQTVQIVQAAPAGLMFYLKKD